jgi:hypothetical protein
MLLLSTRNNGKIAEICMNEITHVFQTFLEIPSDCSLNCFGFMVIKFFSVFVILVDLTPFQLQAIA